MKTMVKQEQAMQRRPVMVFAGEFWAGASGAGLADGFRQLGWAVQEVDARHYFAETGERLALKIGSRLTRRLAADVYRERVLKECRLLEPDVFITIKGTGVTRDVLARIRQGGTKTVMYYPDLHFAHGGVTTDSFNEYDLFVTTKSFQMPWLEERLGSERVACVPHGYSYDIHKPMYSSLQEEDFQFDVLYAGNHSPYKQQWLEDLLLQDKDLGITIIGNRWQRNVAGGVLESKSLLGPRDNVAYARAIQRAKINVAIHSGPADSGWEDLVSTRTFEIPACKGFMLHIDNSEVREFFEPGVDIDVFSSPEELRDKIRFYLARPELRSRMVERAYAKCTSSYSYRNRAGEILHALQERSILDTKAWDGSEEE